MKQRIPALLVACCMLYIGRVSAQMQHTYFIVGKNKIVSTRDSAEYTRVVSLPDSGSKYYHVTEYYLSDKIKLTGRSSQAKALVLEGDCISYFPNGEKKQVGTYLLGMLNGDVYTYYPNGHLNTIIQYGVQHPAPNSYIVRQPVYKTCNDSIGKHLAVDGNGSFVIYTDDFKQIKEQGPIKVGLKDGEWKGIEVRSKTPATFTETYQSGKFISGVSVDADGVSHPYDKMEVQPTFSGGIENYYHFLSYNIRYPAYEKENNIQGQVIAQFIVESDGSLSDIRIMRSPSQGLGIEAKRVISMSPKWIPGLKRGVPVDEQYAIPINFSLGSR
jgi:TonB family protein